MIAKPSHDQRIYLNVASDGGTLHCRRCRVILSSRPMTEWRAHDLTVLTVEHLGRSRRVDPDDIHARWLAALRGLAEDGEERNAGQTTLQLDACGG